MAIGLDAPIWILQLGWKPDFKVSQIDHFATLEGHRENVCALHFMSKGQESRLLSVSHDRTFNIWSIDNLECLYESSVLGNYSFTSSILFQNAKNNQILTIGNCDGKKISKTIIKVNNQQTDDYCKQRHESWKQTADTGKQTTDSCKQKLDSWKQIADTCKQTSDLCKQQLTFKNK